MFGYKKFSYCFLLVFLITEIGDAIVHAGLDVVLHTTNLGPWRGKSLVFGLMNEYERLFLISKPLYTITIK